MEIKFQLLLKKDKKLLFYDNFIIFVHSKTYFMKTIKILKVLINILYILLLFIFALAIFFVIAIYFFNESLPLYLQGYKMLFNSFFDWKLFLVPFSTVINFILFTIAVYYLRKCIDPFIDSDFYSIVVIKNLKKAGRLFIFIGLSTILFRLVAVLYFRSIIVVQGYSGLLNVESLISSIDITTIFLIIIGLFFLLFSNTFENAKRLKQENDLTI
jgi:Protein of unknown function (DUF2975)